MKIENSVVLVTGANRGLGRSLVRAALAAGAAKVYAAARDPAQVNTEGDARVQAVLLDVTQPDHVQALAEQLRDVTLLINNAGISRKAPLLSEQALAHAREQWETNVMGPLMLSRAFAPILAAQGGGAIVNVLSVLSWLSVPNGAPYSMSKAAAWAMSNGLRLELAAQGTQVTSVHVGMMDTDMTAGVQVAKANPDDVARLILEGVEAGATEVLADEPSQRVKRSLSTDQAAYLRGSTA